MVKKKKLYGFDAGKKYKFIYLKFKNSIVFNKVKNLWYEYIKIKGESVRKLTKLEFEETETEIYESSIPSLLRFFHIRNISTSGWIKINKKHLKKFSSKKTICDYEFYFNQESIIPLNKKEDHAPLKICSFDIEASSSNGDFPLPIKNYKKLADNLVEYWFYKDINDKKREIQEEHFKNIIYSAFDYIPPLEFIDKVYPKEENKCSKQKLTNLIETCLKKPMKELNKLQNSNQPILSQVTWDVDEEEEHSYSKHKSYLRVKSTIIELLNDKKFKREDKINEITKTLDIIFPRLEGDKTTFIGSTFWKYGERQTYLNHCIVLGECSEIPNVEIQSVQTEKELLLAWTSIIQKENPDVVIGYNIFGFDFTFMYDRANELGILREFLKLSKVKDEICGQKL